MSRGLIETHDTGGVLRDTDERFSAEPVSCARPSLPRSTRRWRILPARLSSEADGDVLGFLHALMMQIYEHMDFDEGPRPPSGNLGRWGSFCAEARCLPGLCPYPHCLRPAPPACRRGSSPGISCAPTARSTRRPATPGRKPTWPDLGWVGFDAANGICTTDAHARIAVGLDYLGAAPVRRHPLRRPATETLTVRGQGRAGGSARAVAEPVAVD